METLDKVDYLIELLDTKSKLESQSLIDKRLTSRKLKNMASRSGLMVGLGAAVGGALSASYEKLTGDSDSIFSKLVNAHTGAGATVLYNASNILLTRNLFKKFTNDLPNPKECFELLDDVYELLTNIAMSLGSDFSFDDLSLFIDQYKLQYNNCNSQKDKCNLYLHQVNNMLEFLQTYIKNKYLNIELEYLYFKSLLPRFDKLKPQLLGVK